MNEIRKVAVIGGGLMGGGIAALCARQGLTVLVKEATPELAEKAKAGVYQRFEKWQKAGHVSAEKVLALKAAVSFTADFDDVARFGSDLVIEAIVEMLEAKLELFAKLDGILPAGTIFASNTSTLPIRELAAATERADRFVGMHFFNPPTTMMLVEVIPGRHTSDETVRTVTDFTRNVLDKTPIRAKDREGFLVNGLLLPYLGSAVRALESFDFKFEDLDKLATDMGWPMGPYKLLDTVGIDTAYYAGTIVAKARLGGDAKHEVFEFMVKEGRLGDKAGSGFYKTLPGQTPLAEVLRQKYQGRTLVTDLSALYAGFLLAMVNEAVDAYQSGVATKEDIETGAVLGLGCPKGGPLHIADELGLFPDKFFESW